MSACDELNEKKWDNFDWCSIREWVRIVIKLAPTTIDPRLPVKLWDRKDYDEFLETCEMVVALTKKAERLFDKTLKSALGDHPLPLGFSYLPEDKDN